MADDTPRRLSADSNDDRSPSPPANTADTVHTSRHGSRAFEALYPDQSLGEGSGNGSRLHSLTNHRSATVAEPLSPERRPTCTIPVRPCNPITRSLTHSLEAHPGVHSDAPSQSRTQAQNPVENPILTIQSSTPAWWVEGGEGPSLYSLGSLASTTDLNNGGNISEAILNQPYSQTRWSAPPDVRSSTPGSPDLPAEFATGDDLRLTQDLLQQSQTPSPPPVSGGARSDAVQTANMPQLPIQAHIPASTTRNTSLPSGHQPESSYTSSATDNNSRHAQFRSALGPSSPSPLSGTHTLCAPNVSPLSGYGSRSVSSSPKIYTPSGKQQLADPVLGVVDSSSTLFHSQEQHTPLVRQQPEVQLELAEALNLTPNTTSQPIVTVAGPVYDSGLAPTTKNAVKVDPERIADKRRFHFPRYKFRAWQPEEKPWESSTKRRNDVMVGFNPDISLMPSARYAGSKIWAQRSRSDYLKWAQGGKQSTQTRDGVGLPANKARPSISSPRLLATWEKEVSWRREIRARHCPGYRWEVHGVLNLRHGNITPKMAADASEGLQNGADDQNFQPAVSKEQSLPVLSKNSTKASVVPVTTRPSISDNSCLPAPLPTSDMLLFRALPAIHDQNRKANSSETDSLYADPSASVALLNQDDDGVCHNNTETIEPYDSQHSQVSGILRTSVLAGSRQKFDAPMDTETKAIEDILASLNRAMDLTFDMIKSLAVQHIRNGALDHALHEDIVREAVHHAFGTMIRADNVHGPPSLELLPSTEPKENGGSTETPGVTANRATEPQCDSVYDWVGNLTRASDALHRILDPLAPPVQEPRVGRS